MPEDKFSILALGDSYTIGEAVEQKDSFPFQLKRLISSKGFLIKNPEIIAQTGWTTTNLIHQIEENPPSRKAYSLVTLLIGVNNQYQNKPINLYKEELQKLCKIALKYAANTPEHVVVLSIPDYAFTLYGQEKDPRHITLEIDLYNQINRNIAQSFQLNYVYITDITRRGLLEPKLVTSDRLHPSPIMYSYWTEKIMQLELFN